MLIARAWKEEQCSNCNGTVASRSINSAGLGAPSQDFPRRAMSPVVSQSLCCSWEEVPVPGGKGTSRCPLKLFQFLGLGFEVLTVWFGWGERGEPREGWISLFLRSGHCHYNYLLKVTSHFHLFFTFQAHCFLKWEINSSITSIGSLLWHSHQILLLGTVQTNGLFFKCCISFVPKLFLSFPSL